MDRIGEQIKESLGDKLNPSEVFSARNLKKQRGSFWTCFIAAFLLVLLATVGAIYIHLINVNMFEDALLQNVDYKSLGTDESSVRSFARETIFFLTDGQASWNPQITVSGLPAGSFIPQAFRDHMQTVKDGVTYAKTTLIGLAAIVLVLLGRAMTGKGKRGFSIGGYYLGAVIPLAVIVGVGLWAYLDFDSMWMMLHKTLIPDGIFPADERVMVLFPVSLFEAYLYPITKTYGILIGAILLLPLILAPISKLMGKAAAPKKAATSRKKTSKSR